MATDMRGSPEIINIHDELHARCLVLDDGENRVAFVVVDILGLHHQLVEEAKEIIQKENDITLENVVVSSTHTHSITPATGAPPFNEYQEFLKRRIADVVKKAIFNLEPARIGWGAGSLPEHVFVRRWFMKSGSRVPNPYGDGDDKVRMNPGRLNPNIVKPAGEPDPEISVISIQSLEGDPIALFANYSLHYVGGVPRSHISADYYGIFAERIKELLGASHQDPPFIGIMSNGTSGDVNNINYASPGHNYPPYARMKVVAYDVAKEVKRVYETIEHHDWVKVQSAQQMLPLKVRKPDDKMVERAKKVLSEPDWSVGPHGSVHHYNKGLLSRLEMPDVVEIPLQSFKIGELAIATIPFETFAEIGLEIKAKNKPNPSFTISIANGYLGYLPTPRQHEWRGYEVWTNRYEYEASVKIIDTLMKMFKSFE